MQHRSTSSAWRHAALRLCGNAGHQSLVTKSVMRAIGILALAASASLPAMAVDGCKVLLCLAAPNWREVPQCVPTIHQLHRDLARGKPFPTCKTAGAGNSASHAWADPPRFCPPQYTHVFDGESGPIYSCDYTGAVTVVVNGSLYTRTWWRAEGDTVTQFSPIAKKQLGAWDRRFDADFAAWLAARSHRSAAIPV